MDLVTKTIDAALNWLQQGGEVMYVIAVFSLYTVAVILYKSVQFARTRNISESFLQQLRPGVDVTSVLTALQESSSLNTTPSAQVVLGGLKMMQHPNTTLDAVKEEMNRIAAIEMRKLANHMRGLELTANIAPLLGLLGTVIGMVQAFATVENAGARVDPSLLAGGIWTALLTTVFGLCVAIPAMTAHNMFDVKLDKIRHMMQDVAVRVVAWRTTPVIAKPVFASAPKL